MEPIINSQLPEFKVQAFQNGNFKTVTNEDVLGKWAIFFFYPADFTFVCPTELVDMAEKYGTIMAAVAVFDTHMEMKPVAIITPAIMAPGEVPTNCIVFKAMRLSKPQR